MATECRDPNSFSLDIFFLSWWSTVSAPELCHHLCIPDSSKGEGRRHWPALGGDLPELHLTLQTVRAGQSLDFQPDPAARQLEKTCAQVNIRNSITKKGDGGYWESISNLWQRPFLLTSARSLNSTAASLWTPIKTFLPESHFCSLGFRWYWPRSRWTISKSL